MKQKKINTITRKQGFGKRCQLWIPVRTGSLSCCRLAQTKNIVIDVTLTVSKYIPHTITYHTHEQIIRTHQTNCTSINRQDNNKEPRTILWDRKNVIRSKSSRPPTTKTKRNKFDDNKMKRWEQYLVVIHRFTIVTTIKFIGLDATVEKKTTKKQKDNKTHGVGGRLLVNENKTKGVATGAESARKVGFFEGLSAGRKVSLRVRLRLATSERTNTNARQHTDTESHTDARRGGARVFRLFCLAAALLFSCRSAHAALRTDSLRSFSLQFDLIRFCFLSLYSPRFLASALDSRRFIVVPSLALWHLGCSRTDEKSRPKRCRRAFPTAARSLKHCCDDELCLPERLFSRTNRARDHSLQLSVVWTVSPRTGLPDREARSGVATGARARKTSPDRIQLRDIVREIDPFRQGWGNLSSN